MKKKEGNGCDEGEREEGERGSLKRVNWDVISDRRLIKVTALVMRKDATANGEIRGIFETA